MSTVTPGPRGDESPGHSPRQIPAWLEATIDLIKWILSDHRRSRRALLFLVLILLAGVVTAWVLGPSLGAIVGSGVVGGGVGVGAALATRRRRDE